MTDVRVSVVLITYNHERFLAQALDGVLGQRTDFDVEILVTEDHSTDSTRAIIAEYAARHRERIRPMFSAKNLNTNEVGTRAIEAARGELVAMLDGDDFWTVPHKLQRQVEFLDAHPECSMCFHDVRVEYDDPSQKPHAFVRDHHKGVSTVHDIIRSNFIAGCSPLIRRQALLPLPAWYEHAEYGDWPLYILAARHGPIGYVDEVMGVYRRHSGGYWSGRSARAQYAGLVSFFDRLAVHLGAEYRNDVRRARARWKAALAQALADEGSSGQAARAMIAALRDDPHFGSPAVRRRLVDLGRYVGRTVLGSRSRPANAAP
jgi:glycosyltransferase involved in cell wall biosynthesis